MCSVKSRSGSKTIVALLVLSVLLVSPCWSVAPWVGLSGLFGLKETTEPKEASYSEVSQQSEKSSQVQEVIKAPAPAMETQDFSVVSSTDKSLGAETERLKELLSAVSALQTAYTESQEALMKSQEDLANLSVTSTQLSEQLESLKEANAISDAEYNEVKETLVSNVDANIKATGEISKLREELAKAKAKNGTKGFATVNAVMGFKNLVPTYGVGANLGVRVGNHVMLTAGADYMLGSITSMPSLDFNLDNLRVTCGFGWMF